MSRILLPKYTFLNGPVGSGKTTLANLLLAQDPDLLKLSFADPIRTALTATFYPDSLYEPDSIDLTSHEVKDSLIPNTKVSHRQWMIEFGKFMHKTCSPDIFGCIAWRASYELNVFYRRFVLDGLRTSGDILPFFLEEKKSDLLIINLHRREKNWDSDIGSYVIVPGVPFISLHNDAKPASMISALKRYLGVTDDRATDRATV